MRRQVLRVKGCLAGSKAENLLEQGDMVLAINKEPVTCFRDIENACQALDKSNANDGNLQLTIFRQVGDSIFSLIEVLIYFLLIEFAEPAKCSFCVLCLWHTDYALLINMHIL